MVSTIAEPSTRLVYPATHADAGIGGIGQDHRADEHERGFCEHYRIGRFAEPDEADGGEPADRDRELKEEYDPPHSPFGQIYTLVQQGAFTYDEIMNRIPWCVVLTMISDQGRMRKKKEREEVLQSEEKELEFFGLK